MTNSPDNLQYTQHTCRILIILILCYFNLLCLFSKDYIIPTLALVCIIVLLIIGALPQDQDYHHFADNRTMFGVSNFLNVITNLPFTIIALMGLSTARQPKEKELKLIASTLFLSFLLLTFGSGYYHLVPNNITLVYDRIPIVMILMSFFAFIIYDRIDKGKGFISFIIFNIVGSMSVVYWGLSENAGAGDLRWYAMVQFFPVIAVPLILMLYKSTFNHAKEVIPIFIFFGLAKLSERFDYEIFNLLKNSISGHSLKHLFMAAAGYELVVLMRRRFKSTY